MSTRRLSDTFTNDPNSTTQNINKFFPSKVKIKKKEPM